MGWKQSLRSANAAQKRADEARARNLRATDRVLTRIDQNADDVVAKAYALESALERDVLKALELKYYEGSGFQSKAFEIRTDIFKGEINLIHSVGVDGASSDFAPSNYESEDAIVTPLDVLVTQWATIVAFKVTNKANQQPLRLSWVKVSDPTSSPVFLVDTENNRYYYPISTDLKGDVVFGQPRTGLIAFQPFSIPTRSVQIHFSNVRLGSGKRSSETFSFGCSDASLDQLIDKAIHMPRLSQQIKDLVQQKTAEAKQSIAKPKSGCLTILLAVGALSSVIMACVAFSF